jgi:hypothetical protein
MTEITRDRGGKHPYSLWFLDTAIGGSAHNGGDDNFAAAEQAGVDREASGTKQSNGGSDKGTRDWLPFFFGEREVQSANGSYGRGKGGEESDERECAARDREHSEPQRASRKSGNTAKDGACSEDQSKKEQTQTRRAVRK